MKYTGILLLLFFLCEKLIAQNDWYLNFSPGIAYTSPSPLLIRQTGYPEISFWAKYKTESLQSPVYYSCRVGFCNMTKGWEMELNHLKIILKNKPDEIQQFSITHGYNQLFVNRTFIKRQIFGVKIGAGVILAHPENIIRNLQFVDKKGLFNGGYYLTGPALQIGLFRELYITNRFFLLAEGKVSFAFAQVPIYSGKAHTPVLAFHLQLGPGFYFTKKEHHN